MKKIKVYLQYPWKFPDSSYYKYLIENPPKDTEYFNAERKQGFIAKRRIFLWSNFMKRNIRRLINAFKLTFPNAHLSPEGKYDLIHCAHCLSSNKDNLWVADFEGSWQFYVGEMTRRSKKAVEKILFRDNCKKIMPWTELVKEDILKDFPELKNKLEVIYPAVPVQKLRAKKNKIPTIIYVSRYFWIKGGIIALETLRRIKKRYKINEFFISDVPKEIKENYKDINIIGLVPQQKLYDYYRKSDIFFYPSLVDTFGFSLLEAMSFGLPIVAVNTEKTKSIREIVRDGKTGFIIDIEKQIDYHKIKDYERDIINKLYDKCGALIKYPKLRRKMSQNCIKEVKNGKFSIIGRNKKLRKIYEEALGSK